MKTSIVFGSVVLAALSVAACSSSSSDSAPSDSSTDGTDPSNGTDDSASENEDSTPHAGGNILFAESHAALSGSSNVSVSASFYPNVDPVRTCGYSKPTTKTIDGCVFAATVEPDDFQKPICDDSCEGYCAYDAQCKPKCVVECTKQCDSDSICTFDAKGKQYCKAIDDDALSIKDFNAGALSFSGETGAVTIRPPYNEAGTTSGIGFIPESEVKVSASGASEVGLEAFKGTFTTTTMLETSLKKLSAKDLYGTGPIKLTWAKGGDDLQIVLTAGEPGYKTATTTCKAQDATGAFSITRKVLNELGKNSTTGKASQLNYLSIQMMRTKKTVQKGIKTKGEIEGVKIQPDGWVNFISTSSESVQLKGCASGTSYCEDTKECVYLSSDENNCGECGNVCPSGGYCSGGECQ